MPPFSLENDPIRVYFFRTNMVILGMQSHAEAHADHAERYLSINQQAALFFHAHGYLVGYPGAGYDSWIMGGIAD